MTRVHRKPNKKGKIKSHEKSKQRIHSHAVALAFAFAPGGEAAPRLDGGPSPSATSKIVSANSDAGAKLGKPDDILPVVSISFAPVGLTLNQTARLNLVNMNVANGITVSWRFIDAKGAILAQSSTTLGVGKIVSVDFKRHSDPLPNELSVQLRAEVQLQLDILTYGVPSDSLRRSLEVFNNNTGETTVYMGGEGS
jgi:hypothetical protein